MTAPHGRETIDFGEATLLPPISHHLRWRDGGWARTPMARSTPTVLHLAPESEPVVASPSIAMPIAPSPPQRWSAPREHLAALLRGLARRLDYAGERAARPS